MAWVAILSTSIGILLNVSIRGILDTVFMFRLDELSIHRVQILEQNPKINIHIYDIIFIWDLENPKNIN